MSTSTAFFRKNKWSRVFLYAACAAAAVYAMIYADVVLRARHAYLEGEKYMSWHRDPSLKETALREDLKKTSEKLEKELKKGTISKKEYDRRLETEEFVFNRRLEESSVKYAYVWYQTTVELFSPPESRWVKLARQKMSSARELWKQELNSKNIPFEEYMLE